MIAAGNMLPNARSQIERIRGRPSLRRQRHAPERAGYRKCWRAKSPVVITGAETLRAMWTLEAPGSGAGGRQRRAGPQAGRRGRGLIAEDARRGHIGELTTMTLVGIVDVAPGRGGRGRRRAPWRRPSAGRGACRWVPLHRRPQCRTRTIRGVLERTSTQERLGHRYSAAQQTGPQMPAEEPGAARIEMGMARGGPS